MYFFPYPVVSHGKRHESIERCIRGEPVTSSPKIFGASGCHVVRTYAYPETVIQEDRDPTFGTEMLVDWGEMDCWNWKWIQKMFLFLWTHFMRGNPKSSGETSITPHKLNLIMTAPAMLIMEEFISQQMLPCGKRQFSRDPPLILLKRSVTVYILEVLNTWRWNFSRRSNSSSSSSSSSNKKKKKKKKNNNNRRSTCDFL